MEWNEIASRLPEDGEKVLCYLPKNYQFLPGKTGEKRFDPILILRFVKNFYAEDSEKRKKHGPHFWLGEGLSNHFFEDVSHWMPLPQKPQ